MLEIVYNKSKAISERPKNIITDFYIFNANTKSGCIRCHQKSLCAYKNFETH